MHQKLINSFLNYYFPDIESAILFGSYIDHPDTANDIDLLLLSNRFFYSAKESFVFEGKAVSVIKFSISQVFNILAKHYQQGDFYRRVFTKGVIVTDKNKDAHHIRNYINQSYPKANANSIALRLNETIYKLTDYKALLKKGRSEIEHYAIASQIILLLIDYFLYLDGVHFLKSEKFSSKYFNEYYPIQNQKLLKLTGLSQKRHQKKYLLELDKIINEYNIPILEKYSNALILDDYTGPELTLYIENLFSFDEIKQIISNIKLENPDLSFYIYQVDEGNQESMGCYIVFNNAELQIDRDKHKWINFFKDSFIKYPFRFPYNNLLCYPEIKFMGKKNEQAVNVLLTQCTEFIFNKNIKKEEIALVFLNTYLSKAAIDINDIYNLYLGRLVGKSQSANYITNKYEEIENTFLSANAENTRKLVNFFKKMKVKPAYMDFNLQHQNSLCYHFQVIDRLISLLFKKDFEKLFYIYCIKIS